MGVQHVKVRYLDASAIVKLFFREAGSDVMKDHYHSQSGFCTTSLCLTEALGVLKSKWRYGHMTEVAYFDGTEHLLVDAWSGKLKIDEVTLLSIGGIHSVKAIAEKYKLDWSDALQLETIKKGRYAHFAGESQTILITADEGLARAARDESIRVWDCLREAKPEWA
jgi:predicted nucleic acid-binding protein